MKSRKTGPLEAFLSEYAPQLKGLGKNLNEIGENIVKTHFSKDSCITECEPREICSHDVCVCKCGYFAEPGQMCIYYPPQTFTLIQGRFMMVSLTDLNITLSLAIIVEFVEHLLSKTMKWVDLYLLGFPGSYIPYSLRIVNISIEY